MGPQGSENEWQEAPTADRRDKTGSSGGRTNRAVWIAIGTAVLVVIVGVVGVSGAGGWMFLSAGASSSQMSESMEEVVDDRSAVPLDAFVEEVLAHAERDEEWSDAMVMDLKASYVRPDGTVDLTLRKRSTIELGVARRPDDGNRPVGAPTPELRWREVRLSEKEYRSRPMRGAGREGIGSLPSVPQCSARELWKRAIRRGAPRKEAVATVEFRTPGSRPVVVDDKSIAPGLDFWSFRIRDRMNVQIPDDCAETETELERPAFESFNPWGYLPQARKLAERHGAPDNIELLSMEADPVGESGDVDASTGGDGRVEYRFRAPDSPEESGPSQTVMVDRGTVNVGPSEGPGVDAEVEVDELGCSYRRLAEEIRSRSDLVEIDGARVKFRSYEDHPWEVELADDTVVNFGFDCSLVEPGDEGDGEHEEAVDGLQEE
jgi:hypothetical protein